MATNRKRVMINLHPTNEKLLEVYIKKYEELNGIKLSYSALINDIIYKAFEQSFEKVYNKIKEENKGENKAWILTEKFGSL